MGLNDKITNLISFAKNRTAIYPSNIVSMHGTAPRDFTAVKISGRGEVILAEFLKGMREAEIVVDGKTYYKGTEYSDLYGELRDAFGVYSYGKSVGWRSFLTSRFTYSSYRIKSFVHPIVFNKSFELINRSSSTQEYRVIYCSY